METVELSRAMRHTVYKNRAGKRVPNVSTILGIMGVGENLIDWAVRLTEEGLDHRLVRDHAATVGKIAHHMVMCEVRKQKAGLEAFSEVEKNQAYNSMVKFYEWVDQYKPQYLHSEMQLTSEAMQCGGTCDMVADIGGKVVLVDIKTGQSGIWPNHWYQLQAYRILLEENGIKTAEQYILSLPSNENAVWLFQKDGAPNANAEVFVAALALYRAVKRAGGRGV